MWHIMITSPSGPIYGKLMNVRYILKNIRVGYIKLVQRGRKERLQEIQAEAYDSRTLQ